MNRTFEVNQKIEFGNSLIGYVSFVCLEYVRVMFASDSCAFPHNILNAILDAVEQPKTFDQIPAGQLFIPYNDSQPTLRDVMASNFIFQSMYEGSDATFAVRYGYEKADQIIESIKQSKNENI